MCVEVSNSTNSCTVCCCLYSNSQSNVRKHCNVYHQATLNVERCSGHFTKEIKEEKNLWKKTDIRQLELHYFWGGERCVAA